MRVRNKSLVVGALCAALIFGGTATAVARTESSGGGTWTWGTDGAYLYSNYIHLWRVHSTFVENCHKHRWYSRVAQRGYWAKVWNLNGCPYRGSADRAYYVFH